MPNEKNKLFTIGQFAEMHEINKKTLMWYDEVGIFKPAVIKENGYRYYTFYQSSTLTTILLLRDLDVSIREIQEFMKNRSAPSLKRLLEEKIIALDQSIARLKALRKTVTAQKDLASLLIHLDLSEISIVEKEEAYLAVVVTKNETPFEKEIERVLAETKKYPAHRMHDACYGSMITVDNLYGGKFEDYSAFFMEVPNPESKKGLYVRPKGRYLRAFCKGDWDKMPERYREILDYAEQRGLVFCGYAYEIGINEVVIDHLDDYITQIEIPLAGA